MIKKAELPANFKLCNCSRCGKLLTTEARNRGVARVAGRVRDGERDRPCCAGCYPVVLFEVMSDE